MSRRRPPRLIVVTGAPRSGTTAVGRFLSLGKGVGTLHEPFNQLVGMKEIEHYFEIPGSEACSEEKFEACMTKIERLDLSFKPGLFPREQGLRKLAKRLIGGRTLNSYRLCKLTPGLHTLIWKDPFACFAAARIAAGHQAEIVVTLRNPWAVAASFKRMEWAFDLPDLRQRLEQAGIEGGYFDDPAWEAQRTPAINAAFLWHAIHDRLYQEGNNNPRFHFVDLDRVVATPVASYQDLYAATGLAWSTAIEEKIQQQYTSTNSNSAPEGQKAHDSRRDLSSINSYWKKLLDPEEEAVVSRLNAELWSAISTLAGKASP